MICYVILHYQAIDETINCVNSIFDNNSCDVKIIIIDNASPNKSGDLLYEKYFNDERIVVIKNEENLGFAKGNNIGYKKAKGYNPSFIVVLNSDVVLSGGDVDKKLDYAFQEYKFDVLGPDIFSTKTNTHQNPQRNVNYTFDELKRAYNKLYIKNKLRFLLKIKYLFKRGMVVQKVEDSADYESIQYGKVLHGACYVYSEKYIDKHEECFFNDTFMYYESYILHYLGMREKLNFVYYPEIKVYHNEDVSTDMTYQNQYKKSCFVNKCLLDSARIYLDIMKNETVKLK